MAHQFFLTGEIKRINISKPKDPNKSHQESAVLLVQYGAQREASGGAVDFVNAVLVRVPSFKFPKFKDRLKVGQKVEIIGHLQGIVKTIVQEGYFTTELVADILNFEATPEDREEPQG